VRDQRAELFPTIVFLAESLEMGENWTDASCTLRSVAEVGLSARTRKETGHCSNAGGLSAVCRDQLYMICRCTVFLHRQRESGVYFMQLS